ncbi:PqqD family protein [Actinoplanes sp. NPDC020271]|uniref:PqqD family protein n=1 Tax=Actinoplanes sp. NPDC020271 TaxID=3363896 RepID=UPI0037B316F8
MSLHISDAVIWHENGDGISIYHVDSGEFLSFNGSAAQIWVLLDSDGERAPVIDKLALMYAAGNATLARRIRAEVDEFIDAMLAQGLIAEGAPA